MHILGQNSTILESLKKTGPKKILVLTALHGGLSDNNQFKFRTIFGPKICIFLRYAHVSLIFGLRWTQPNGIITCPHHEVTLDNFGFLVGSHLTAWWAVIRPHMAKIWPGGRKTARRAAERPPTGKPKLSRVTSGCGEDIIPLSRVRPTQKMGVIWA